MNDYNDISNKASDAATNLHTTSKREARKLNLRVFSRGFEFLSLDADHERDEGVIDYCDRDEMTPELVEKMAKDCLLSGSAYLAIGYGVDSAETEADHECGNYEPMFDWIDLDEIAVA